VSHVFLVTMFAPEDGPHEAEHVADCGILRDCEMIVAVKHI